MGRCGDGGGGRDGVGAALDIDRVVTERCGVDREQRISDKRWRT